MPHYLPKLLPDWKRSQYSPTAVQSSDSALCLHTDIHYMKNNVEKDTYKDRCSEVKIVRVGHIVRYYIRRWKNIKSAPSGMELILHHYKSSHLQKCNIENSTMIGLIFAVRNELHYKLCHMQYTGS